MIGFLIGLRWLRGVAVAMKNNVKICPYDNLPCAFVDSCDDVLSLLSGLHVVEGSSCSRAVFRVRKK